MKHRYSQVTQTEYHTGISLATSHQTLLAITVYKILSLKLETVILQLDNFLLVTLILRLGIDWHNNMLLDSYVPASFREKLLEVVDDLIHFEQLISCYPHMGTNILDLFFVSHSDFITSCQNVPGISDHGMPKGVSIL